MSEHTTGPWMAEWLDGDYYISPVGDKSVVISIVMPIDAGGDKYYFYGPVTDANARLLAAAPDLLDALIAMVDSHPVPSSICKERPAYESAIAAIAKARSPAPSAMNAQEGE